MSASGIPSCDLPLVVWVVDSAAVVVLRNGGGEGERGEGEESGGGGESHFECCNVGSGY